MNNFDLDNFRFLTGHGKQVAAALDRVMSETGWPEASPEGQLQLFFRPSDGTSRHRFVDWERDAGFAAAKLRLLPEKQTAFERTVCIVIFENRVIKSSVTAFLPMLCGSSLSGSYQLYAHSIEGLSADQPGTYIGVTKRHWRERWLEHLRAARSGSHYKFHEAIRNYPDKVTGHYVLEVLGTEEEAMNAEEETVAGLSLYPKGLNMIPGGYAGMRFLHRIGAVRRGERVSPDEKHDFINRFFEAESRAGRPNPFSSANWLKDDYAEKVICGGPDRLKPSQIREARYLKEAGMLPDQIAAEVGARNAAQVRRLLGGSTYSRIH